MQKKPTTPRTTREKEALKRRGRPPKERVEETDLPVPAALQDAAVSFGRYKLWWDGMQIVVLCPNGHRWYLSSVDSAIRCILDVETGVRLHRKGEDILRAIGEVRAFVNKELASMRTQIDKIITVHQVLADEAKSSSTRKRKGGTNEQ